LGAKTEILEEGCRIDTQKLATKKKAGAGKKRSDRMASGGG